MSGTSHVAFFQDVNDPVLIEQDKSAGGLSPWSRDLPHPVLVISYTGQTTMDIGPKLTGVEMAPYPLIEYAIREAFVFRNYGCFIWIFACAVD